MALAFWCNLLTPFTVPIRSPLVDNHQWKLTVLPTTVSLCLNMSKHYFYLYQLPPTPYPCHFFNWWVMELSFLLVNCLLVRGAKVIYGWLLEQPSLNAQTHVTSQLAPLLDEGVASSSVHFPLIYNSPPPFISPISSLLISWEREPVTFTPLVYWLRCLCCYHHFRNHLPLRKHTCKPND